MYICTHMYMYKHVYVHICTYVCVCVCVCLNIHINLYVYIIYMYMYIYDDDALLFLCASPSVCCSLHLSYSCLFLDFSFPYYRSISCSLLVSFLSSPSSLRLACALSLCLACVRALFFIPLSCCFFFSLALSVPPVSTRAFPVMLRGVRNKFCVGPFYERGVGAICGVRYALTESHCNTLQHVATRYNTLHHAVTRCTTLRHNDHNAPNCNTLHHTTYIFEYV